MDLDLVAAAVLGAVGGVGGAFVYAILPTRNPKKKIGIGSHEHQFDTMRGDGKGWRCGICGQLRGGK